MYLDKDTFARMLTMVFLEGVKMGKELQKETP
jgi:hypothetical protein